MQIWSCRQIPHLHRFAVNVTVPADGYMTPVLAGRTERLVKANIEVYWYTENDFAS